MLTPFLNEKNLPRIAAIKYGIGRKFASNPLYDPNLADMIIGFGLYDPKEHTLYKSAASGNMTVVRYLCDQLDIANRSDIDNELLASVIKNNHTDMFKFLMKCNYIGDLDVPMLMFAAVEAGNLEILRYLYENYPVPPEHRNILARFFRTTEEGFASPLQFAAAKGHLEIVDFLFNRAPNAPDDLLCPISAAAANQHLDIVKYLIARGADPNHGLRLKNSIGLTSDKSYPIVVYLYSCGANGISTENFLRQACMHGNRNILEFLIKIGIAADVRMSILLRDAATLGHLDIVKCLIKTALCKSIDISYAIRYAAMEGHLAVLRYMSKFIKKMEHDLYADFMDGAISHGNMEIIRILLSLGVAFRVGDPDNARKMAKTGNLEMLKFLHKLGMDMNNMVRPPLWDAAAHGHIDVVKYLVSIGADIHCDGDAPVRWAVRNGFVDIAKYLIERSARYPNKRCKSAWTAAANGHIDVVMYLVDTMPNIGWLMNELIHAAASSGQITILKALAKRVNIAYIDTDDLLICGVKSGNVAIVRLILELGLELKLSINITRGLFVAAERNETEIVQYLAERGADVCTENCRALGHAISQQNSEMFECLIEHGGSIDNQHTNVMYLLTKSENIAMIDYLFRKFGILAKNELLLQAVKLNRRTMMEYAIGYGANAHIHSDAPLKTAILASSMGNVQYLLKNGADLRILSDQLMGDVARSGAVEMFRFLAENRFDVHTRIDILMREAARGKRIEIIKYLAQNGADLSANNYGVLDLLMDGF
jgi:ankyrin repeat protein